MQKVDDLSRIFPATMVVPKDGKQPKDQARREMTARIATAANQIRARKDREGLDIFSRLPAV